MSIPLNVHCVGAVECHQFVLVKGYLELGIPGEGTREVVCAEGELNTFVVDGTIVAIGGCQCRRGVAACTHVGGQLQRHQHVF